MVVCVVRICVAVIKQEVNFRVTEIFSYRVDLIIWQWWLVALNGLSRSGKNGLARWLVCLVLWCILTNNSIQKQANVSQQLCFNWSHQVVARLLLLSVPRIVRTKAGNRIWVPYSLGLGPSSRVQDNFDIMWCVVKNLSFLLFLLPFSYAVCILNLARHCALVVTFYDRWGTGLCHSANNCISLQCSLRNV